MDARNCGYCEFCAVGDYRGCTTFEHQGGNVNLPELPKPLDQMTTAEKIKEAVIGWAVLLLLSVAIGFGCTPN